MALASITVAAPPCICVLLEVASKLERVGASLMPITLKLPFWLADNGVFAVAKLPPSFRVRVTARVLLAPPQVGFALVLVKPICGISACTAA